MGIWSALSGQDNHNTQANNASRASKAISQAKAAKAAGRGSRQIRAAAPAKKTRGWKLETARGPAPERVGAGPLSVRGQSAGGGGGTSSAGIGLISDPSVITLPRSSSSALRAYSSARALPSTAVMVSVPVISPSSAWSRCAITRTISP